MFVEVIELDSRFKLTTAITEEFHVRFPLPFTVLVQIWMVNWFMEQVHEGGL